MLEESKLKIIISYGMLFETRYMYMWMWLVMVTGYIGNMKTEKRK